MANRLFFMILALLVSACAQQAHLPSDWAVSDERLLAPAARAAETWCAATDGAYCPEVYAAPSEGQAAAMVAYPDDDPLPGSCAWYTHTSRWHEIGVPEFTLVDAAGSGCGWHLGGVLVGADIALEGLMLHELGHAAGLHDVSDWSSAMHPASHTWLAPSDEDIAQVRAMWSNSGV